METPKPKLAVHKFSSCDGCQLALLNAGEALLQLAELVDIVHFAEAGPVEQDAEVEIALIEGSVSTPRELEHIQTIRENSRILISIGACATAGGLQALRNMADAGAWMEAIYAKPEHIELLGTATPISDHVRVDLELWGCPVNTGQVVTAVRDLLSGVKPRQELEPLCLECKRQLNVCTLVTQGEPCMGPVTKAGCGAICPKFGRACYACYGPAEKVNDQSLGQRFEGFGLLPEEVARRFRFITSNAPAFKTAGERLDKYM